MRRLLIFLVAAGLVLPAAGSERSPQVLYMLNCQGCHLPDGSGMPGKVPTMRGMLGKFIAVEGGREFIARVPGTANSKLDDADVARLLNWLVPAMGPQVAYFRPFDASEIHALRADKLSDVAGSRSRLIEEIHRFEQR